MNTVKLNIKVVALALLMGLIAFTPGGLWAQSEYSEEGVTVRLGGDVNIGPDETEGVVAVFGGDATIAGAVEFVIVVDGQATLTGAKVGRLVVAQGIANLQSGSIIDNDVELINSELVQADDVVIRGEVLNGSAQRIGRGMLLFGLLFGIGVGLAILASGLIAAAVAPHVIRSVGAIVSDEFGKTVLAALLVFVGFPIIAFAALMTIVGIPIAIGIVAILLPALFFIGYLISGIRLGDYVLGVTRGRDEAWHPYLAAIVGLVSLLFLGWLPVIGAVVSPIAGALGGGALAIRAWRVARIPKTERHAFVVPEGADAFGIP